MKARQLEKLGVPPGLTKQAKWLAAQARQDGLDPKQLRQRIAEVVADPAAHRDDPHFAQLAEQLDRPAHARGQAAAGWRERAEPAPWHEWGRDLDPQSVQQIHNACRLPVAVSAALMPDAHVGYGLPIGGVLATEDAVIPYAVGVDIACRMKLSVLDMPTKALESHADRLEKSIETETRFGIGSQFRRRREHEVLDDDWSVCPITHQNKDKAHAQLGSSGSGNHFVEFGILTLERSDLGLEPGQYLALLSHSGSRGVGASVCSHYSRLAMQMHPQLPRDLQHLAWLDLDSHEGQEYWQAMELMGRYASANHALIHKHIAKHLGAKVLTDVENHHNFAWRETHRLPNGQSKSVIVHRKGATPAANGVLGVIPGSMASPGYVVRGKGKAESLESAAHGAGRVMSRRKAKETYRWAHVRDFLKERGVKVLSAGVDEVPFVYKNIDQVMGDQEDLVDPIARFDPRLVKMAPAGEKPED